jgi:hypothetical protein
MASGLLILRQEQDAGNNESRQNAGGTVAAECQAAMINWLVEQIASSRPVPRYLDILRLRRSM